MEEFEIKGTLEGINQILQQDFFMSEDEARFFIYIILNQEDTPNVDKKEVNAWYLNQGEKYTGQIFSTHYSINFNTSKKELFLRSFIFLSGFFFCKGFNISQLGLELLYIICSKIQHIKDEDYCVFSRIIELNIGSKGKLFKTDEIITANKDQKCDYQNMNWECPYLRKDDACMNTNNKIQTSLKHLEKLNIIKKVGNSWVLQ